MRVRAVNDVGTGIYGSAAELLLSRGDLIAALYAPVHEADDDIDILPRCQGKDPGAYLLLAGAPACGVEADADAVAGLIHIAAVGRRVGNARVVKHLLRILQTGLAEVHGVVVRQGDELHAAVQEDLNILRRAAELECARSRQRRIRKAALEVGYREIVVLKILNRARERPAHVTVQNGLKVVVVL